MTRVALFIVSLFCGVGSVSASDSDKLMQWYGATLGMSKKQLIKLEPKCSHRFEDVPEGFKQPYPPVTGRCITRPRKDLAYQKTYSFMGDQLYMLQLYVRPENADAFINELKNTYGQPTQLSFSKNFEKRLPLHQLEWKSENVQARLIQYSTLPSEKQPQNLHVEVFYSREFSSKSFPGWFEDPQEVEVLKDLVVSKDTKYLVFMDGKVQSVENAPSREGAQVPFCYLEKLKAGEVALKTGEQFSINFKHKQHPRLLGLFEYPMIKNKNFLFTCLVQHGFSGHVQVIDPMSHQKLLNGALKNHMELF